MAKIEKYQRRMHDQPVSGKSPPLWAALPELQSSFHNINNKPQQNGKEKHL
jgi:hypothetical protein